jgi:NagD protein
VLAGWFPEFTMPALEAACQAVWDGAELYSCSQTPFFAVAGGRALGTSRAISAMIRSLTGCGLRVVGKPSLDALRAAADRLGVRPGQLAVVGDDRSSRCRWRTAAGRWPSRWTRGWVGRACTTAFGRPGART